LGKIIVYACICFLLVACGPVVSTANIPAEPSPTSLPAGISTRAADGMNMVQIPSGIPPGGTKPLDDFWFDQTDITNSQYLKCVGGGVCEIPRACDQSNPAIGDPQKGNDPITCARWSDTKIYCEWVGGRLPTQMEWEYAAQFVNEVIPPWGNPELGFRCVVPNIQSEEYWPTQGWITSSLEEQGMDPGRVGEGIEQLELTFPNPHSLLIVRHGFLVLENYYRTYHPDESQDIASVNKSFLSALIGIAIDQGAIPGLDQKMMDYFPEYIVPDVDPQTFEITIENLLTMTSGFYWPEIEPESPGFVEDAFFSGKPQDALLRSPIVTEPGKEFNYCTACTHILSIILQESTGMPAQDFAQKFLMDPLGISPDEWSWNQDIYGYNTGGWGFNLTPRDMAKLGYLYLHNGAWEGKQIIPEEWVRESLQTHINLGVSFNPPYQHYGYGYLWWTTNMGGHPVFYALGHGGQYIYILPTLDLVVVITQKTESHNAGDPFEIIRKYFAAAVQDQ
jgi:CubicO group peptidase (beta-lactamase class C family)